uniref:Reverse transcriptase domain-containing protein n=1 Tax=Tanacetum cinerariifolium TaxID=118510 RepID=A0A699GUN6_TANCI|nr:reverse transcriptase domain-containing protein [Tanacetum cinerariifolium]
MIKELNNRGQEKVTPRRLFNGGSGGGGSEKSHKSPLVEGVGGYFSDESSISRSRNQRHEVDQRLRDQVKASVRDGLAKEVKLRLRTEVVKAAFLMKKLLSELPTLTTPKKGEALMMYLSTANEAVTAMLLMERAKVKCLYTISCGQAIKEVLLSSSDQCYHRQPNKANTLTEVNATPVIANTPRVEDILESSNVRENLTPGPRAWRLYTNGASNSGGSESGLILIASNDVKYSFALRLNFSNSNSDAKYEALLVGLQIATKMQVKDIYDFVDSKLVASHVEGSYKANGEKMIKYQDKF